MRCVKVEVCALGSRSLTVLMVSVDVKQHSTVDPRAQELCGSRGVALGSQSLIVLSVSVD